jgi:hypothetical protein
MHYEELFRQIVRAFPSFEVQVENHLNYNDELLPHLLMADVGRAVGSFSPRTLIYLLVVPQRWNCGRSYLF